MATIQTQSMKLTRARFAALLLLCLYGLGATPFASVVFAALADWNGEHEVVVKVGDGGGAQIVLHHRARAFTPGLGDHSQRLARVLTCLCGADRSGDHVFAPPCSASAVRAEASPDRATAASEHDEMWVSLVVVPRETNLFSQASRALPKWRQLDLLTKHRDQKPRAGLGAVVLVV